MTQPFPAHMSVSVEEVRTIANMAARLYTQAAILLEVSGHGLADDLAPTGPTEFDDNVYTFSDYQARRRLGVSR